MDRPKVSVLCVTHDRRAFMPWLFWNFTKQTLRGIELVLVDSTPGDGPRIFNDTDHVVSYRHVEENHVGKKYELALELARGESVMLWGDDDWHHPNELEYAYTALRDPKLSYVGWREGWYMDLGTLRTASYRAPNRRPCASTALVRRDHARRGHFTKAVASDTEWFQQIEDGAGVHAEMLRLPVPHSMWLVHGGNMTPRLDELPWDGSFMSLVRPSQCGSQEIVDTHGEILKLRNRLTRQ